MRPGIASYKTSRTTLLLAAGLLVISCVAASAQQTTGVPGSPDATTTINGRQLPPPDPKFGGVIKDNALQSKAWWPPRVVSPKGAPNILLIMTDDVGFAAPSTFGGVIPTPSLDRIAQAGLRYTQFHSTSLCSPTRAALITGRNHHAVGFGVVSEIATGFPGYDSIIQKMRRASGKSSRRMATQLRGSARTTTLPPSTAAKPGPLINGRPGWALNTSTDLSVATPASGNRTYFATPPQSIPTSTIQNGI